jgi:hypothetical protein
LASVHRHPRLVKHRHTAAVAPRGSLYLKRVPVARRAAFAAPVERLSLWLTSEDDSVADGGTVY